MPVVRRNRTRAKAAHRSYADNRPFKKPLRRDFKHTCGYCGAWERQIGGSSSFHIDHFIPRSQRPDLVSDPENLVYACNSCNLKKGGRPVPSALTKNGIGFLDPCDVDYDEHFAPTDNDTVTGLSNSANFMIDKLSLNGVRAVHLRRERRIVKESVVLLHDLRRRIDGLKGPGLVELASQLAAHAQSLSDFVKSSLPRRLD